MHVEFDSAKDAENTRKHGVSLQRAEDFDLGAALTKIDDRKNYGEVRYRSIGLLDAKLYVLAFTMRNGKLRAISLRTANRQECRQHAEATEVRKAGRRKP